MASESRTKKFDNDQLSALAAALGDTENGFTGTEIGELLRELRIEDVTPEATKRKRLHAAFSCDQQLRGNRLGVLAFIRRAMKPARHYGKLERYALLRQMVNEALSYAGLCLTESGDLQGLDPLAKKAPSTKRDTTNSAQPRNTQEANQDDQKAYDVFISHAWEDKASFVRSLVDALTKRDVRVWYDENELMIGDSLRKGIDQGLANSRFGVVVLSQHFFEKTWTNHELNGLTISSYANGGGRILPIWHKVDHKAVLAYSPALADTIACDTSKQSVAKIAEEIVKRLNRS